MIGLSLINRETLTSSEWQIFNRLYCGMCDGLRNEFGAPSGVLISDEAQFIALLVIAQRRDDLPPANTKCPLTFYRKENPILGDEVAFRYAAAISLLLLDEKLNDDARDEKVFFHSKLLHSILQPSVNYAYERMYEIGFPSKTISEARDLQAEIEKKEGGSLVTYLEPTSILVGELFAYTSVISNSAENDGALREIGKSVGRLVALMDACEDLSKDQVREAYNPIISTYQPDQFIPITALLDILYLMIGELYNIRCNLLSLSVNRCDQMIEHILTRGLPDNLLNTLAHLWVSSHWKGTIPDFVNLLQFDEYICKTCRYPHVFPNLISFSPNRIEELPRNLWAFSSYYPDIIKIIDELGYSNEREYIFAGIFPMILSKIIENKNPLATIIRRANLLGDQAKKSTL